MICIFPRLRRKNQYLVIITIILIAGWCVTLRRLLLYSAQIFSRSTAPYNLLPITNSQIPITNYQLPITN